MRTVANGDSLSGTGIFDCGRGMYDWSGYIRVPRNQHTLTGLARGRSECSVTSIGRFSLLVGVGRVNGRGTDVLVVGGGMMLCKIVGLLRLPFFQ